MKMHDPATHAAYWGDKRVRVLGLEDAMPVYRFRSGRQGSIPRQRPRKNWLVCLEGGMSGTPVAHS